MSAHDRLGAHGFVEPFEPKPRIMPTDVVELYQHILENPPADLRPAFVAEERRRIEVLLALHDVATAQSKASAS